MQKKQTTLFTVSRGTRAALLGSTLAGFTFAGFISDGLIGTAVGQDSPATANTQEDKPAGEDENAGLVDLDEAMVKKIDANTAQELEAVAVLVESAIAKGLDKENLAFANKMLGGVAFQQAQGIIAQLLRGQTRNAAQLRVKAMDLLEKAVASDPSLVDAHLMIAQLSAIPGGDRERAMKAITTGIELLGDDPIKRSEAHLLRSALQTEADKRGEDLDAAVTSDPLSSKALQARALFRLESGNLEAAVDDLKSLLSNDPNNTNAAVALVQTLIQLDRTSDAVELLSEAITKQPSAALYLIRAEIRRKENQIEDAIADLDRAISMDSKNPAAYLLRGELRMRQEKIDEARADIDQSMALQPTPQGLLFRSIIAAEQKRYADAINDMKLLARNDPGNDAIALQLASYYQQDNRPTKAIEIASEIIERDAKQWQALRLRGDAYLSISEHAKAVADYRQALAVPLNESADDQGDAEAETNGMTKTSRSGLTNNLSWVLATSPQDKVRNGKDAIKYGLEAAELSEYKEPHILSTLAAAYAESGDFEKAIEWAKKAVELGESEGHEQLGQLQDELKSYQEGKPWREAQSTSENKIPILAPEDVIDT